MNKMTQWYDAATTCPDKPGVYEIRTHIPSGFSKWDGAKWCMTSLSFDAASISTSKSLQMYELGAQWRGFTERQEA